MSNQTPFVRRALPVDFADLKRGSYEEKQEKHKVKHPADELADRMMGRSNPLRGADNREAGSTFCSSCGRWHRLGNPCPRMGKDIDPETMINKGRKLIVSHPKDPDGRYTLLGNAFHNVEDGTFATKPDGGPHAAEVRSHRAALNALNAALVKAKKKSGSPVPDISGFTAGRKDRYAGAPETPETPAATPATKKPRVDHAKTLRAVADALEAQKVASEAPAVTPAPAAKESEKPKATQPKKAEKPKEAGNHLARLKHPDGTTLNLYHDKGMVSVQSHKKGVSSEVDRQPLADLQGVLDSYISRGYSHVGTAKPPVKKPSEAVASPAATPAPSDAPSKTSQATQTLEAAKNPPVAASMPEAKEQPAPTPATPTPSPVIPGSTPIGVGKPDEEMHIPEVPGGSVTHVPSGEGPSKTSQAMQTLEAAKQVGTPPPAAEPPMAEAADTVVTKRPRFPKAPTDKTVTDAPVATGRTKTVADAPTLGPTPGAPVRDEPLTGLFSEAPRTAMSVWPPKFDAFEPKTQADSPPSFSEDRPKQGTLAPLEGRKPLTPLATPDPLESSQRQAGKAKQDYLNLFGPPTTVSATIPDPDEFEAPTRAHTPTISGPRTKVTPTIAGGFGAPAHTLIPGADVPTQFEQHTPTISGPKTKATQTVAGGFGAPSHTLIPGADVPTRFEQHTPTVAGGFGAPTHTQAGGFTGPTPNVAHQLPWLSSVSISPPGIQPGRTPTTVGGFSAPERTRGPAAQTPSPSGVSPTPPPGVPPTKPTALTPGETPTPPIGKPAGEPASTPEPGMGGSGTKFGFHPKFLRQVGSSFSSGASTGMGIGSQSGSPGGMAGSTVPLAVHATQGLLSGAADISHQLSGGSPRTWGSRGGVDYRPRVTKALENSPQSDKKLTKESQHLQGQEQDYLNKLRGWLVEHTG